jgi:hypothetical protein
MPMPGSAAPKSLPDFFQSVMDRLILPIPSPGVPFDPMVHGEGLAYDGTQEADRPSENGFALCFGSQWLQQWTGANVAVILPTTGAAGELKTLQSTGERRALFALRWAVEVHAWGRESPSAVGRAKDIERFREAYHIFENVGRVLYVTASAYGRWEGLSGFSTDTEVMRYGELIVATFSVSVPIYDYPKSYIQMPQTLVPGPAAPTVQNGAGL